jgi:hypothetical protein
MISNYSSICDVDIERNCPVTSNCINSKYCHFKHLWKKRNIIVTFQSDQLTEQPKTLVDLGR